MHIYFGGFFALAGLVAIGLLAWDGRAPLARRASGFMGAAWLCLFLTALIAPDPVGVGQKGAILFCILLLGFGLAFYQGRPALAVVATGLLMIALGVLFFTFSAYTTFRLPSPLVLIAPALGGLVYWRVVVRPQRHRNLLVGARAFDWRGDIIALLALLVIATWAAIELWTQLWTLWAGVALLGTLLLWLAVGLHEFAQRDRAALAAYRAALPPTPEDETAEDETAEEAPPAQDLPAEATAVPAPPATPYIHYTLAVALLAGWCLALAAWTNPFLQ